MPKKISKAPVEAVHTPPVGELAWSDSALYSGYKFRPYNPDTLVRRKGLGIYDQMRVDDQVKFCMRLKKQGVLAPGWDVDPASEEPYDVEVADFCRYALNQMVGTLEDALMQVLTGLDYGYSVTEIIWQEYAVGPWAGKFGPLRLKGKRPSLYTFDVDEYGNLRPDGLVQTLAAKEVRLPIDKFLIYSYQKEFDNWYGESDLRTGYRAWWSKDNIIKFWNIYLERFGNPMVIGKYKSMDPGAATKLQNAIENMQSRTSMTFKEGEYDISLLEAQRRSTSDYETALNFYDRALARSILVPDRVFQAGEVGAYSQSQTHFDVFLWALETLRSELAESVVQEQLLWRMVDYNFADIEDAPSFKFQPLTAEQKVSLAGSFADAVQKGAVRPTFEDENHIRKILNFPEKMEEYPFVEAPANSKEKKMAQSVRAPTPYEKRVNFNAIDAEFKAQEAKAKEAMRSVLIKQRDAMTAFVAGKLSGGKMTTALINTGMDFKYLGELKVAVRAMFEATYQQGRKDGKAELPSKFALRAKSGIAVTPQQALDYFGAKSDFVVKGIKEPLLRETQGVLLNALKIGETTVETVKKLQGIYDPWLADGSVIIDGAQTTAHRLETIIRTNMSEAYAWGRRDMGDSTDGYVIGYQFSEVLDDRTTEISRYVDGLIISADSPYLAELTYPLHYNDRGMFVFVTQDDLPVDFISESEALRIIAMQGNF